MKRGSVLGLLCEVLALGVTREYLAREVVGGAAVKARSVVKTALALMKALWGEGCP